MTEFHRSEVEDAGRPFRNGRGSKYCCFDSVVDKFGVYVFQHKRTKKILYVGSSKSIEQSDNNGDSRKWMGLRSRIEQHYRPADTGGDFCKNWCRTNCQCNAKPCISFSQYEELLKKCRVEIFYADVNNDVEINEAINTLEKNLIYHLEPKYNKETMDRMDERFVSQKCIKEIIGYIC